MGIAATWDILENGESQEINRKQRDSLLSADVIYLCEDCNSEFPTYHIRDGKSWSDVDEVINSL